MIPVVSVVMPVYNGERFLCEAIDSILNQSFCDFEFLIVDDGSTDCTPAILKSYADRDTRVKIFRQDNCGIVASLNRGCELAQGIYVARMDADDICAPERFARQVAFLETNPAVGIVGCGIYENIDSTGEVLHTSYLPEDNETIQRTLVERWCFLHPSIMFRRELLPLTGNYRKEFEGAEDHDFILRILEHSEAHNIYERLIRYRLNPKGLSVFFHQYMNEVGEVAMRLAQRRRSGQPENLTSEIAILAELKRRRKAPEGLVGTVQSWRDSLYAANRYYGMGCRELYAGRLANARRCFIISSRTNVLFVKSWAGIMLSLMPIAANLLRFVFRSSRQQHDNLSQLRSSADNPR